LLQVLPLKYYIQLVFNYLNLDWEKYVISDPSLLRPTDLLTGRANPAKAAEILGWKAKHTLEEVVKNMIEDELVK
jgi:GDPmannose 4,6-dehydratase